MSASDHINIQLFHGTLQELSPKARKIRPYLQGPDSGGYAGQKVAFATSDLDEAKRFGPHVYEVSHDEHSQEGWGNTFYSEKGFNIIGKVV